MELKLTLNQLSLMRVMMACTPREDPEAGKVLFNAVDFALTNGSQRREAMLKEYINYSKDEEGNNIMTVDSDKIKEFEEKMVEYSKVAIIFPDHKYEEIRKVRAEFPNRYVHPETMLKGILGEKDLAAWNEVNEIFNPVTNIKYD